MFSKNLKTLIGLSVFLVVVFLLSAVSAQAAFPERSITEFSRESPAYVNGRG